MKKVLLLGGIILDRYFEVDCTPEVGQDAVILNAFDRVGGCSLNAAITLKNLGAEAHIVTKLGDDETGKKIAEYIRELALPMDCLVVEAGEKTGYCLTLLDRSGERTFLTFGGREKDFSADVLPTDIETGLSFVYITGYYLLNAESAARVLELLHRLKISGCPILFDPGSLVGNIDAAQLAEVISLSKLMTPNDYELETIQKSLGIAGNPAQYLLGLGVEYLVLKKGAQGVEVHSKDTTFALESLKVKAVDSTGAGDSFAGGLIFALMNGMEMREAAEFASACGAFAATITGPHGHFSRQDIVNLIDRNKEAKK